MDMVEVQHEERRRVRRWWWMMATAAVALAVPVAAVGRQGTVDQAEAAASTSCTGATYTVVAGDGWWLISSKTKVSLSSLLTANNATTATALYPGMVLCLPSGASTTTTAKPTSTSTATTTATTPPSVSISQFPVQGPCWFTDTWGAPRSGGRSHEGVDIIAKSGLYLYAVSDGTLTKQYLDSTSSLSGNGWRLTRADGTYFFYAHLSAFAPGLKVGSTVKAGQIIGYVGMTGNAGSPHLHFEVHPGGGAAVNPTPTVRAVDGCSTTAVPTQPDGVAPATSASPTTTAKPTMTTAKPTTTTAKPTTTTAKPTTTTAKPTTTTAAPATTAAPVTPANARWQFVAPVLAFDSGSQRMAPDTPRTVSLAGLAGVPAGTPGVMLRVNARNAAGAGHLTVYPCAAGPNGTSTMSIVPGRLNATMTLTAVSAGTICATSSVATDLRIAVVGYQAADGTGVDPMVTTRALDTRSSGSLAPGVTRSLSLSAMGVPAGTKAVTATVTILTPGAAGSLGIGACGGSPWIVAYSAGTTQTLSTVTRINDSGLCLAATSPVQVLVDVTGGWKGTAVLGVVNAKRVFDSRQSGGVGTTVVTVPSGLPSGATRGQYTVSLVAGSQAGFVQVWNCQDARPSASVAFAEAKTTTSVTVTLAGKGGSLCVAASTPVQVTIDLVAAG